MYKMYKTQGKQQFFYFLSGSRYLVYIWFLGTISIAPSCLLRYLETYLSVYFFSIFVVLHTWYTTAHLHIVDSSTKLQEQNLCFFNWCVYFFPNFKSVALGHHGSFAFFLSSVYFTLHCERFHFLIVLTSFIIFNYARDAIFVPL